MHATASLLLIALLTASCPSPIRTPDADLRAAAIAALDQLDPQKKLVVVLPAATPAELRAALSGVRRTIEERDVVETESASFPAGHLRLERLEVSGDTASVAALLGPVPKAKEGEILLDCGTRYSFTMTREGGAWKVGMMSVAVC